MHSVRKCGMRGCVPGCACSCHKRSWATADAGQILADLVKWGQRVGLL